MTASFSAFLLFLSSAAATTASVAVITETNYKKRYYNDPNKVLVVKKIAKTVHKVLLYGRADVTSAPPRCIYREAFCF